MSNKKCKYCKLELARQYKARLHEEKCKYNPDIQNSFNPDWKIDKYTNWAITKHYKK